MAKIAILGFGTVGSGVYEVLCRNAAGVSRRAGEPVEVKSILDPKDFSNHPAAHLFVTMRSILSEVVSFSFVFFVTQKRRKRREILFGIFYACKPFEI